MNKMVRLLRKEESRLEHRKSNIDQQLSKVQDAITALTTNTRRRMSPAVRKKIARSMRKNWEHRAKLKHSKDRLARN